MTFDHNYIIVGPACTKPSIVVWFRRGLLSRVYSIIINCWWWWWRTVWSRLHPPTSRDHRLCAQNVIPSITLYFSALVSSARWPAYCHLNLWILSYTSNLRISSFQIIFMNSGHNSFYIPLRYFEMKVMRMLMRAKVSDLCWLTCLTHLRLEF